MGSGKEARYLTATGPKGEEIRVPVPVAPRHADEDADPRPDGAVHGAVDRHPGARHALHDRSHPPHS